MMEEYKISKTLLGNANHAAELLAQRPDLINMVLPEPLDNFVVWREGFLDLAIVDPDKVILKITHEAQCFVLIWNKPEEPHHD
jgi:hypothetical protein